MVAAKILYDTKGLYISPDTTVAHAADLSANKVYFCY